MTKDILNKIQNKDIERRLKAWDLFIQEIENGYTYMIYEYINDLGIREAINIALKNQSVHEEVREYFTQLDDKFNSLTFGLSKPIVEGETSEWWHRAPRKITDHLYSEFKIYDIDLRKELVRRKSI